MRFSNEHLPAIRGDSVDDPPSKKRTCNENFTNLDKSGYGGQNEKHKEIPFRFQTQNERHYTPPCDVSHFWGRIIFITLPHTVNHFLGLYNIH